MATEQPSEKKPPASGGEKKAPLPKVVTLNKALKLAQTWVDKMSASDQDEPKAKDFEGRPPGYNQFNELNFFFLAFLDI
jgi:hypothetical protein